MNIQNSAREKSIEAIEKNITNPLNNMLLGFQYSVVPIAATAKTSASNQPQKINRISYKKRL